MTYTPVSQPFASGKSEAELFLLSDADFIYELIDHAGSVDETTKSVPQPVIYFFQTFLHGADENQAGNHLTLRLALLVNPITDPGAATPDYNNFTQDLELSRNWFCLQFLQRTGALPILLNLISALSKAGRLN